jgi:exodeoxyribonuclease III
LKLATFNINNILKRLPNLLDWLAEARPDIACLQELKNPTTRFPEAALAEAGYSAVWHGQPTWSGVAILSRGAPPVLTRIGLPGDPDDAEARYIEAAVSGILVGCLYAPNGGAVPGPKFERKRAWNARLLAHAADLLAAEVPVVLAGDYNIVPEPRDIYPTRSYDDSALIHPEARATFRALVAGGWTDALRAVHPDEVLFTFWDYRRLRWERDAGLRLDHLLLSPALVPRLRGAGIDRAVRGRENASDHAPTWIALGPAPRDGSVRGRLPRPSRKKP